MVSFSVEALIASSSKLTVGIPNSRTVPDSSASCLRLTDAALPHSTQAALGRPRSAMSSVDLNRIKKVRADGAAQPCL